MSIIRCIIDFKFYNEIYKKNVWKNLLYVFILSLLVYYAGVFINVNRLGKYLKTELTTFINNLPEFRIEDGILDVETDKPLIFGNEGYALIIDDKNAGMTNEYNKYSSIMIVGEQGVTIKNGIKINELKYKDILGNFKLKSIDKRILISSLPFIKGTVIKYVIVIYIFWYLVWLPFYKMWSILILSVIALLIDNHIKSGLTYKSLFNISMYAITLPWILKLTYKLLDLGSYLPGFVFFLVYWSVASIYVYKAIKEVRRIQLETPSASDELEPLEVFNTVDEFTIE